MYTLMSYGTAIAAFVCGLTALHLLISPTRFWLPQVLLAVFFGLFAALLALTTIQLEMPDMQIGPIKVAVVLTFLPIAYLFCQAIAHPHNTALTQRDAMHLAPAVAAVAVFLYGDGLLLDIIVLSTEAIYTLLTLQLVLRGRSAIDLPKRFQSMAYRWNQFFLAFYGILLAADIAIAIQLSDGSTARSSSAFVFTAIGLFIAATFVGLGAMGKNSIFTWLETQLPPKAGKPTANAKKNTNSLAQDVVTTIEVPRNYGDEDLTITKLARRMGVSVRQVSEAINKNLACSFSELVSQVRVKAATDFLSSPEGQTTQIVDVAYRVGFRSKSNFNKEFKKITNCTPSEYRQLMRLQQKSDRSK